MSQTSIYGTVIRGLHHDATGYVLRNEWPVATNQARYIMNNAAHLSDENTQYRVNWVARALTKSWSAVGDTANEYKHICTYAFLCAQNYMPGFPDGLVIRIAGGSNTATAQTLNLRACVCPFHQPIGIGDCYDNIAYLDGTTTGSDGTDWIIEGEISDQYTATTPAKLRMSNGGSYLSALPAYTESDSSKRRVSPLALRLSIYGYVTDDETVTMYVTGVLVREYRKAIVL